MNDKRNIIKFEEMHRNKENDRYRDFKNALICSCLPRTIAPTLHGSSRLQPHFLENYASANAIIEVCCRGYCTRISNWHFIRTHFSWVTRRNKMLDLSFERGFFTPKSPGSHGLHRLPSWNHLISYGLRLLSRFLCLPCENTLRHSEILRHYRQQYQFLANLSTRTAKITIKTWMNQFFRGKHQNTL